MKHDWLNKGPAVGTSRDKGPTDEWECQNCGATVREDIGVIPSPDVAFWTGKASEVEECAEMLVHEVSSR